MIHLSGVAAELTEDAVAAHVVEHGPIVSTKLFEVNGKKQALMMFDTEEQATEALVYKQATALGTSIVRISFSQL